MLARHAAVTSFCFLIVSMTSAQSSSFDRAVGLFRQGIYYEAESAFREAAREHPTHGDAHHGVAMCLYLTKRYRESLEHFAAAERCPNPKAEYFVNHAVALETISETDEALRLLDKALAIDSKFVNGWFNLGKFRARLGDWTAARKALRRTLELDPKHVGATYELAQVEFRSGHPEEAEKLVRRVIGRDPDHVAGRYLLSRILARTGRRSEAARVAKEAMRLQRRQDDRARAQQKTSGLLALAYRFLRERKINEAIAYFRKILEIDPKNNQALFTLHGIADQLEKAGRAREAAIVRKGLPPRPSR